MGKFVLMGIVLASVLLEVAFTGEIKKPLELSYEADFQISMTGLVNFGFTNGLCHT